MAELENETRIYVGLNDSETRKLVGWKVAE